MSITKQSIIHAINSLGEEEDLRQNLLGLFNAAFVKFQDDVEITYKTTVADPFLVVSNPTKDKPYNLNNLYEWYLTKNAKFIETGQSIKGADPEVPEFKTTLALILKDLMLLLLTKHFPLADENDDEEQGFEPCCKLIKLLSGTEFTNFVLIYEIFKKLNNVIQNNYKYLEIIELIIDYYKLFNFGDLQEDTKDTKDKHRQSCIATIQTLRLLSTTYFMIYPSFTFVSYTKILYFLQAPVLMLKMSNIRELTDGYWMSPITQIWHDITFHSSITHCLKSFDRQDDGDFVKMQEETYNLYRNLNGLYDKFQKKFKIIKKYINVNYKNLDSASMEVAIPERIKYYISYVLFLFLHEADYNTSPLNQFCVVLNINDLETSLKAFLEKPEEKIQSSLRSNKIYTRESVRDILIKRFKTEFASNDKEFKRFTLYNANSNANSNANNINKNEIIEKSYDIFKTEIDKMFKELSSSNTQLGGYKKYISHKLMKNTKKINKSYRFKSRKNKTKFK